MQRRFNFFRQETVTMIRISVMYPKPAKFDFDYYKNKHIKMVHKLLDSYGLVKSEVNTGSLLFPY